MLRFPVRPGMMLLFAVAALAHAQPVALTVNPASREEVRQFYNAIYSASEGVPIAWTGSYATGNAGDTSAAFKEATRLRVNFFRAMAGVPANIVFNPTYSQKAQQAALMQSVNAFSGSEIVLNHIPPSSWKYYTAGGAEASEASNLSYRTIGADAINSYVADHGDNNRAVGHRRWLLFPQTLQMGTGDVPGENADSPAAANALWIRDSTPGGTVSSPRPATRTTQVAYPPAGYTPYQLVWPRWSFSYPGADFSAATVTMTRAGLSIPVTVEPLANAQTVGEPTIVWVYNGIDSRVDTPHVRPDADVTYSVTITNVKVGATTLPPLSYNVIVFDPDRTASDTNPTAVIGSNAPVIGQANAYTASKPAFAAGFDWRTLRLSPYSKTYDAENGLADLNATVSTGYSVAQTVKKASGNAAYHLAHPSPRTDQILELPDTLYVTSGSAAISFASRIGYATVAQTALVQISTDDRVSWVELFTQPGTTTPTPPNIPTEAAFTTRRISLSDYVGRTIRVRFNYSAAGSGAAFPQTDPAQEAGWFLDDIVVSGVQAASTDTPTRVASGTAFSFTPPAGGTVALQARGVLFGSFPIEWGQVFPAIAVDAAASANPGRLVNMSIRTNVGAGDDILIAGAAIGGARTSGNKAVLIRAVGPTLASFGLSGALADSTMTVFQDKTQVAQNDDWAGGFDFASVGAFPFTGTPVRDAAIYNPSLPPNSYSIQIAGKNSGTGIALAEIYDATPNGTFTTATPRLVNVSARAQVGTGENILIAGFVVGGATPVRVLVRAVGPTLGVFGVTGFLGDPKLEILNSTSAKVAENDNWGGTLDLKNSFTSVGAFGFPLDASRDAALVTVLSPGSYTAKISGVNDTTGVALVEVYELP